MTLSQNVVLLVLALLFLWCVMDVGEFWPFVLCAAVAFGLMLGAGWLMYFLVKIL